MDSPHFVRHISATVADLHGPDLTKKTEENRLIKPTSSDFNHIFMWTEIKPEITAHPHRFRKH